MGVSTEPRRLVGVEWAEAMWARDPVETLPPAAGVGMEREASAK